MSGTSVTSVKEAYAHYSDWFKAAWTFNQFLLGIQKMQMDSDVVNETGRLQAVHTLLKSVAQNLNSPVQQDNTPELEKVARSLKDLVRTLLLKDIRISPANVRQFFEGSSTHSGTILIQIVKFYLYCQPISKWTNEQKDKVDFLLTRLAAVSSGPDQPWIIGDPKRLYRLAGELLELITDESLTPEDPGDACDIIRNFRRQFAAADSFDELKQRDVLNQFRQYKHQLGMLMFDPEILVEIVDTNLALRNLVNQLCGREELRIDTEFRRVFDQNNAANRETSPTAPPRQGDIPEASGQEHTSFTRFHSAPQPRATGESGVSSANPAAPVAPTSSGQTGSSGLDACLSRLTAALEQSDPNLVPEAIVGQESLSVWNLDPYEVIAYRRRASATEPAEREEQLFLIQAAALRMELSQISSALESMPKAELQARRTESHVRARNALFAAEVGHGRFQAKINRAIQDMDREEVRRLRTLQIRLLHHYTHLWLLTFAA